MTDISDVRSAYLAAKAEVEEFAVEFEREWYAPQSRVLAKLLVADAPEAVRENLRRMAPDLMAAIERNGKNGK